MSGGCTNRGGIGSASGEPLRKAEVNAAKLEKQLRYLASPVRTECPPWTISSPANTAWKPAATDTFRPPTAAGRYYARHATDSDAPSRDWRSRFPPRAAGGAHRQTMDEDDDPFQGAHVSPLREADFGHPIHSTRTKRKRSASTAAPSAPVSSCGCGMPAYHVRGRHASRCQPAVRMGTPQSTVRSGGNSAGVLHNAGVLQPKTCLEAGGPRRRRGRPRCRGSRAAVSRRGAGAGDFARSWRAGRYPDLACGPRNSDAGCRSHDGARRHVHSGAGRTGLLPSPHRARSGGAHTSNRCGMAGPKRRAGAVEMPVPAGGGILEVLMATDAQPSSGTVVGPHDKPCPAPQYGCGPAGPKANPANSRLPTRMGSSKSAASRRRPTELPRLHRFARGIGCGTASP